MSGYQSDDKCPNCGKDCMIYSDTKPFAFSAYSCNECGLQINPVITYLSLEELNKLRNKEDDGEGLLLPLKKLPEQTFKY